VVAGRGVKMLSNRDYQIKKAELRLRMELQRQDITDVIRDVKAAVNPWARATSSLRYGLSFLGPAATAAGFAIPLISRFFMKKKKPEFIEAPAKPSSWKSYIIPAFRVGLKFFLK